MMSLEDFRLTVRAVGGSTTWSMGVPSGLGGRVGVAASGTAVCALGAAFGGGGAAGEGVFDGCSGVLMSCDERCCVWRCSTALRGTSTRSQASSELGSTEPSTSLWSPSWAPR